MHDEGDGIGIGEVARRRARKVGILIRRLREERGWSQDKLSERAGLDRKTVTRIENTGKATIETLLLILEALDVDYFDILHSAVPK